eukprot:IDg19772t1
MLELGREVSRAGNCNKQVALHLLFLRKIYAEQSAELQLLIRTLAPLIAGMWCSVSRGATLKALGRAWCDSEARDVV